MKVINHDYKLIMFDMDGTLIDGRSIFIFSEKLGFKDKLIRSLKSDVEAYEISIEIATFLKGLSKIRLLEIFRDILLHKHVEEISKIVKEKNIKTAIVTDSYQFIADDLKDRLNFDFAFANDLIFKDDTITGEVKISNVSLKKSDNGKIYSICKEYILEILCNRLNIKPNEVIAVGDGLVDIGMIKNAGLGIAFNSSDEVKKNADIITDDLSVLFDHI